MASHTFKQEPRILFLVNDGDNFIQRRLNLARRLIQEGFTVAVGCPLTTKARQQIEASALSCFDLPAPRASLSPLALLRLILHVRRLIQGYQPNLIQTAGLRMILVAWAATLARKQPSTIHLVTGLGTLFSRQNKSPLWRALRYSVRFFLKKAFHRKNGWVICQNQDDLDLLVSDGIALHKQTYLIPGSGIDTTQWSPKPEPPPNPFVIIFVSRLIREKGLGDLVQAFQIARQVCSLMELRVVGDVDPANPESFTPQQIEEWQAQGIFQWLGKRSDVLEQISAAHLFVFPSVYGEGLPNVLLEAGLAQRAVITYDSPGCREVIRQGDNGMLITPHNIEALAQGIEIFYKSPALRQQVAQSHHRRVISEFSDPIIHAQFLKTYQTALGVKTAKHSK